MRQWRVGSLSMGIMLIAIGAIMIVGRINGWSAIGSIIKWWPVVLVLLGIEILITSLLQRNEQTRIRIDGFSIFMIILIVMICVGAYGVDFLVKNGSSLSIDGIHLGSKYQTHINKNFTVDVKDKDKLIVDNELGRVKVSKGTGENIEVNAEISIYNNDEKYAKSISDSLIKVDNKNPVRISSKPGDYDKDNSKVQGIKVDYDIKVPEKLMLEIKDSFGSVEVEGISKTVNIKNNNGSVTANSVGGDLFIENSFASVNVNKAGGKVEIHNQNGSVNADDIAGSLNIDNKFGSIKAQNVKGDADIEDENGSVDVDKVGGKLTVSNKFGRITANDISGNADIKGGNGRITVSSVGGEALISNEFGSTELSGASKYIKVVSKNGGIKVSSDVQVEKGMDITNEFGSIEVQIPKEQNGTFNAKTEFGSISNDFDLNVNKDGNEQKLNGTIGSGVAAFNITNKNGSIKINSR